LINIFDVYETSAVYQGLEIISPNPFKGKIDIRYCIGQSAEGIELKIYDTSGRLVKDFNLKSEISNLQSAVSVYWDGADDSNRKLPNGIYFCNLSIGDTGYTRKMVLLK
ncbi:unnamed protein product, partial [marine sediment metagenome]